MHYSSLLSPFGELLVASRADRLCYLAFADDPDTALGDLRARFPKETLEPVSAATHQWVIDSFLQGETLDTSRLELYGTPFQLRVWEYLIKIPYGQRRTYQEVAMGVNHPQALRAVGNAIGRNPIALIIPCHRVVRSDGGMGGYRWGLAHKQSLLDWESAAQ